MGAALWSACAQARRQAALRARAYLQERLPGDEADGELALPGVPDDHTLPEGGRVVAGVDGPADLHVRWAQSHAPLHGCCAAAAEWSITRLLCSAVDVLDEWQLLDDPLAQLQREPPQPGGRERACQGARRSAPWHRAQPGRLAAGLPYPSQI